MYFNTPLEELWREAGPGKFAPGPAEINQKYHKNVLYSAINLRESQDCRPSIQALSCCEHSSHDGEPVFLKGLSGMSVAEEMKMIENCKCEACK
jgi:hypothetical protein